MPVLLLYAHSLVLLVFSAIARRSSASFLMVTFYDLGRLIFMALWPHKFVHVHSFSSGAKYFLCKLINKVLVSLWDLTYHVYLGDLSCPCNLGHFTRPLLELFNGSYHLLYLQQDSLKNLHSSSPHFVAILAIEHTCCLQQLIPTKGNSHTKCPIVRTWHPMWRPSPMAFNGGCLPLTYSFTFAPQPFAVFWHLLKSPSQLGGSFSSLVQLNCNTPWTAPWPKTSPACYLNTTFDARFTRAKEWDSRSRKALLYSKPSSSEALQLPHLRMIHKKINPLSISFDKPIKGLQWAFSRICLLNTITVKLRKNPDGNIDQNAARFQRRTTNETLLDPHRKLADSYIL
eukprot:Gb_12688 [translate_table: standard]